MESVFKIITSPEAGFTGLFLSAFLAATLIPVSSEAVFTAFLLMHPQYHIHALAAATIGNSIGGVLMFCSGRIGSSFRPLNFNEKYKPVLMKYGPLLLLASWMPVIGDPLCIAAGWLKLPAYQSFFWISSGKFIRYLAVLILFRWVSAM
jgi:membrane protein YqaA with SNARE-associated domain